LPAIRFPRAAEHSHFKFECHDNTQQALDGLAFDIAEARIKLVLEHIYPSERTLDAVRKTETRHARGKLVMDLDVE
jgi:hypothetical protein